MYRNAIKADPRYGPPYLKCGQAMVHLQRLPEAVDMLRRAVELLPEDARRIDARRHLGDLLVLFLGTVRFDRSIYREVRQLAEEILERDPRNYAARLLLGRVLILRARHLESVHPQEAQKVLAEAVAELREADALRPGQLEVVMPLAKSLWAAGDPKAAAALLESYLRQPDAKAGAFEELSRIYQHEQRFADATRTLEQGVRRLPDEPRIYAALARLYSLQGKRQDQRALLDQMEGRARSNPQFIEAAGVQYLQAGLPEEALRVFDHAASAAGSDRNRYRILAIDALIHLQRSAEAEARNEAILRENPEHVEALIRRASFAAGRGQTQLAIQQLEGILRKSPRNAAAMFQLGRSFALAGNPGMAQHWLAEAVRIAPGSIPPRLELIRVLMATDQYGEALARIESTLEIEPGNYEAELLKAAALRLLRRYDQAGEALASLRRRFGDSPDVLLEEGLYYAAREDTRQAEDAFRRSHQRGSLRGLLAIAELRMAEGKLAEAQRLLAEESARNPDNLAVRSMLAQAAALAGRPEQAVSIYEQLRPAVERDPRSKADLLTRLGELYRRRNESGRALALFEEANQLWPDNASILQNLAVTLDMAGQRERALAFYERSLALRGENAVVLNNLAFHIADSGGDLERALTYAQRARQLNPASLDCLDTLGWIYVKKGLVEPALDIYRDLVRQRPGDAGVHYHFAVALHRKGDTEAAARHLHLALGRGLPAAQAAEARRLLAEVKAR